MSGTGRPPLECGPNTLTNSINVQADATDIWLAFLLAWGKFTAQMASEEKNLLDDATKMKCPNREDCSYKTIGTPVWTVLGWSVRQRVGPGGAVVLGTAYTCNIDLQCNLTVNCDEPPPNT